MAEARNDQPIPPDIGAYNDAIAGMYDAAASAETWKVNDLVAQRLQTFPGENLTVLDLGSGTGQTVGVILECLHISRVVAVDASPKMLAQLSLQNKQEQIKSIVFMLKPIPYKLWAPKRQNGQKRQKLATSNIPRFIGGRFFCGR